MRKKALQKINLKIKEMKPQHLKEIESLPHIEIH
jgi:hypothetical protein